MVVRIIIVRAKFAIGRARELLARRGIIVLRFWNHQIRQELNSVLQAIWLALQEGRQNKPSP
jgi:very-short-patch-repair endonuclease